MSHTQKWMFERAIEQTASRVLVSFLKSEDVAKRLADQLKRGLDKKTLKEVEILTHPDVRHGGLHSLEVRTSYLAMIDKDLDRYYAAEAKQLCDAVVAVIRKHLIKDDFLTSYVPQRQTR